MTDEEKQLHIRIPKEIYTKLKVKCAYREISIQDYLLGLIHEDMRNNDAQGPSLLIVDDEPIVRESLVDSLKDTHDVAAVGSAEEALDLLTKRDFDMVVTDVRLPGRSGVELVREIEGMKPYIMSVVITAYPSVEFAVEVMKHGAVDYLVKPVSADDLLKVINKYFKRTDGKGVMTAPDLTAEITS